MVVTHCERLGVYGLAVKVRQGVLRQSKAWSKEERYALTDQVCRSSRAVGANLAEAWAKRRYERYFVSKLTDAPAEAEETVVWLDVALECGCLDEERRAELATKCRRICGGLVRMMREPEAWCGPAGLIREDAADYLAATRTGDRPVAPASLHSSRPLLSLYPGSQPGPERW